jgi:hypothetical protein
MLISYLALWPMKECSSLTNALTPARINAGKEFELSLPTLVRKEPIFSAPKYKRQVFSKESGVRRRDKYPIINSIFSRAGGG